MADIAAGDLTYTLQAGTAVTEGDGRYGATFKVQFGNGSLTYPTGGIPLTKAKLGCPVSLEEVHLMDASDADGLVYKLDYENAKIRIYTTNLDTTTDGPLVELAGGSAAVAATVLYAKVVGW